MSQTSSATDDRVLETQIEAVLATAPWERRHPVVVDTNAVISDLLRRVRAGHTALTTLAERTLISIVSARHVEAELYEHVPRVAAKCGLDVAHATETLERTYLPLIRFVDLPLEALGDPRIDSVARRDPDDVPLAHLAALLAPCLVLTSDRDLTDIGIGSDDWLADVLVLKRVTELDAQVWGTAHLTAIGVGVPVVSLWYVGRAIARSPIAAGITLGLTVVSLLWYRPQLRSGVASVWERARPLLESWLDAAVAMIEQQAEAHAALRTQLVAPTLQPTVESMIARHLVSQNGPVASQRLHRELKMQGGRAVPLSRLRQILREHPAFIGIPGQGYYLGRQSAVLIDA